jgi:hypothetical protein
VLKNNKAVNFSSSKSLYFKKKLYLCSKIRGRAGSIGILIKLNRKQSRLLLPMAGHSLLGEAGRPVDYNGGERSYLVTQEFSSHHWATPFLFIQDSFL